MAYDKDEDILKDSRKFLRQQIDDEAPLREDMMDDLRFCTLDQWPSDIRREREGDIENGPRPCLTIDKINQYIVQVVNDMRQGKPGINVRPQDDSADVETAKILKGLIRNIEDQSKADIAYSTAGESAAKVGLGYWRITTEYVSNDSFDQELVIKPLPNTFAVYLGPHIMPDGSDAEMGWIVESMPLEKFQSLFPGKKYKEEDFDDLGEFAGDWHTGETVTVVEYYCIERQREELYRLEDGTDMLKSDYDKWPSDVPKVGILEKRSTYTRQLKWCKHTGVEILEKRDLPGQYIPIVEVIGRESNVEGRRHLWGLVRPAKDSLRMYNYFASTITEKMGLAPKAPFIGAVGQFATHADKWRKANRINYAVLEYDPIDNNGNVIPAPERQGATPIEAALLNQMQVIEHDVQTSLGMFKAATGESESQQSGRAILALQRESDTGTYHFGANLGVSIRHCGRILVDLIPHYYDTKRIVRIMGEDGEVQTAMIDPSQEAAYQQVQTPNGMQGIFNPGVGKYDVSITVGPSYNTKRMEAAATFVEMAKGAADPASAAILRYLVLRNSDTAGSEEAAKLLKTMLPPQALQALESKQPLPPEAQAMMQRAAAEVAAMQEDYQKTKEENMQLKAGTQTDMVKIQADHQAKLQQLELERLVAAEEAKLAREKAEAEIALKRAIAEAEHQIERDNNEHEKFMASEKLSLEKQKMQDEKQAKVEVENDAEAKELAPKLIESMKAIVQEFAQVLAQQQEFQNKLVSEMSKKKTITAKSSTGTTLSATIQ
jgi:hypothetical protein